MAASAAGAGAGAGEVSMACLPPPHLGPSGSSIADREATKRQSTPADAQALVDAKIQEGIYKVKALGRIAEDTDREIEVLRERMLRMAAVMEVEVRLEEYCSDLGDMHKARLDYHGASLSEAERRSLDEIRDLAASAVADYEAQLGPVPAFDNPITALSDAIPMEIPASLIPHFWPAAVNGGDASHATH